MSTEFSLSGMRLPDLIRTKFASHLVRLARVTDSHTLDLALERAEGFLEGIEATRSLTPATIEALFIAVEEAAAECRKALEP